MATKIRIIYVTGLLVICCLIIHPAYVYAQLTWAHAYGGPNTDFVYSIQQTSDGGYIAAGDENSSASGYDIWVIKLDSFGNVTWQKTYGGSFSDSAKSIKQTSDGGYIVAGTIQYISSGGYDMWILKLDSSGNVTWQKTYGASGLNNAWFIQQTSDGSYIIAGDTYTGAGSYDMLILKLDSSGNIIWQKTYGGADVDRGGSIQQTSDGGYIDVGNTRSFGAGSYDMLILKLDSSGNVKWQKTYGGSSDDEATSIKQTSDGGYIVAGVTESFGAGYYDIWVLKLDSSGNVTWQKTYGGSISGYSQSIQQTSDGGYIVAGFTMSFGAGYADFWVLKLNPYGTMNSSCTFVNETSINPVDSTAGSTNTNASISSPSFTVTNTTISGINSTASDTMICSSFPGAVPDNDNYPGTPLTITKSGTSSLILNWGTPESSCFTQDYGIYRGTLPWTGYDHASVLCSTGGNTTSTTSSDADSYYYLVVAQNGENEGSYGLDSANKQRAAATTSCLPQQIGTCN